MKKSVSVILALLMAAALVSCKQEIQQGDAPMQYFFSGEIICLDIQSYQPMERYDGIWACASLIHLQEEEILCFFKKIDMYLNDNGIVYASGKSGISTGEVADGRFFLEFTEQLVDKILTVNKQLKLEQLWYTEDVSGRRGFRWLNVVLRLRRNNS